jgi:hypothetical protein
MNGKEPLWTLDDLCGRVALALATGYEGQRNGQVRDVPDGRTVRYYATLGLVDRPSSFQGRTAFYGRRHLLQLVAIKRLQARGLPLAKVQEELLGLTGRALARLAAVDDAILDGREAPAMEALGAPVRAALEFWKEPPAAPMASGSPAGPAAGDPGWIAPSPAGGALPLQYVELAPGAGLLLGGGRPPRPEDVEAVRDAAAPLLELLRTRGLLGRPMMR